MPAERLSKERRASPSCSEPLPAPPKRNPYNRPYSQLTGRPTSPDGWPSASIRSAMPKRESRMTGCRRVTMASCSTDYSSRRTIRTTSAGASKRWRTTVPFRRKKLQRFARRSTRPWKKEGRAVVVDYKFGLKRQSRYGRQVARYMELLLQMGYADVSGYIWYVGIGDIEPVQPGSAIG